MLTVIKHNSKNRTESTDENVISARLARRQKRHAAEANPPAPPSDPPRARDEVIDDHISYPWHASPPDDSATHVVNVTTIEPRPGQEWSIAALDVSNTSDRTIVARLRWENGGGAPVYTPRIVLYPNRATWTGQKIHVTLGSTLTMTVEESRYK